MGGSWGLSEELTLHLGPTRSEMMLTQEAAAAAKGHSSRHGPRPSLAPPPTSRHIFVYLPLRLVFSAEAILPPGDTSQCPETFWVVILGVGGVLLTSAGWRPGMLFTTLPGTDPTRRNDLAPVTTVLRLRYTAQKAPPRLRLTSLPQHLRTPPSLLTGLMMK